MYNLIIYIYLLGVAIASLFSKKVRKMWRGERAAFGTLHEKVDPCARYVWFHAASLGEFEQAVHSWKSCAAAIPNIRYCSRSSRPRATRCARTTPPT